MQAWDQFLALQEKELGSETLRRWLRPLKVLHFDAGNLYLEAKDSFQVLWFEEHIRPKALAKLVNNNNRRINVHLALAGQIAPASPKPAVKSAPQEIKAEPFALTPEAIDPNATWESLLPTEGNNLPYKFMEELLNRSTFGIYNPIYLHGGTGVGKSHMLMAMTHLLRERGIKALYVRAETFTDHVVTAIRAGEMGAFRNYYRGNDAILVDDVHLFARKGATQEEFFHTFNTLHVAGKQIILSSNSAPQELKLIEARLVSRFEWGIVLPIEAAKEEELGKIIDKKAPDLAPSAREFLLKTFKSGPKALCRALEALLLRSHMQGTIDPKNLLQDLIREEESVALTPEKILQTTADFYSIRPSDLAGKSQNRESVVPRQLAMALCRTKLKMPYAKIGEVFSRDHSTVMASVRQVEQALTENRPDIAPAWHTLLTKLS